MDIHADEVRVSSLLNRGDLVFKVPVYQRPYSWNIDQWEELWEDVTENAYNGVHFIGSIVVVKKAAVVKGFNEMEVVDGQQRLATLSILICAIRDYQDSLGNQDMVTRLNRSCLESHTHKNQSRKLFLGRHDDKVYESLLKGTKTAGHNIQKAYDFFREKVEAEDDLLKITDQFTEGVSLVLITAEKPEDAFKLFETLNDRGLELSAVDLIKNYILSKAAKRHEKQLDDVIEIWDATVQHLDKIDKMRFFRQYLLANYPGKRTKRAMYDDYKHHVEKTKDLPGFITEIRDAARLYEQIHEYTFDDSELNEKLKDLWDMKATTSFILLLRLFSDGWSHKDILKVIPAIESFSMRRAICGWSTSEMDTLYNQITNWEEGFTPESICEFLKEKSPTDDEFRDKFKTRDFRQNNQTKYILDQFEYFETSREKKISDRKLVHIEHIMPQRINTQKCINQLGGDWISYLGDDIEKHDNYLQKIGNLSLLAKELNVLASNNPFAAKKTFYEQSEIQLSKDLCKWKDWGIEEIEDRSNQMAEKAVKIWSI